MCFSQLARVFSPDSRNAKKILFSLCAFILHSAPTKILWPGLVESANSTKPGRSILVGGLCNAKKKLFFNLNT